MCVMGFDNVGSNNGFVPDGTKPLHKPMLSHYHYGLFGQTRNHLCSKLVKKVSVYMCVLFKMSPNELIHRDVLLIFHHIVLELMSQLCTVRNYIIKCRGRLYIKDEIP